MSFSPGDMTWRWNYTRKLSPLVPRLQVRTVISRARVLQKRMLEKNTNRGNSRAEQFLLPGGSSRLH